MDEGMKERKKLINNERNTNTNQRKKERKLKT